jgi:hypothetical protein
VCSGTLGRLPRPEVAAAGLHHTAEGGASAAIATVEFHSAKPSAPAPWELEEVARNLLILPTTLPSCHLKIEIVAIVIPIHNSEQYSLYYTERKCHNITSNRTRIT